MTEVAPIRFAVIGTGSISDYHLSGIRDTPGARVEVICGRNANRASEKARAFGIRTVVADWREAVSREDVDAVVIATPDEQHAEMAAAALDASKAVLVQKPLAMTSTDAAELVLHSERVGGVLAVAFMHRHFPEIEALRTLLARGTLGRLRSVHIRNATPGPDWAAWFYRQPERGIGGVVPQIGVHGIDLSLHLFGEIHSVAATAGTSEPYRRLADGSVMRKEVFDYALAHYRIDDVVVGHEMSYTEVAGTDRFRLEVYGEQGTALVRFGGVPLRYYTVRDPDLGWRTPDLIAEDPALRQHRAFTDLVRGGESDDTAGQAVRGLRIAEAVHRAAASGSTIYLNEGEGPGL